MKPYQALIWNEWRRMRGIVLATAGAMVLLWLTLFVLSMLRIRNIDLVAFLALSMLTGLFCGIGFFAFQGEFKSQTDNFLLSLPVSRGRIFWYKYLFNLSICITLGPLCCLLFLPLTIDHSVSSKLATPAILSSFTPVIAIIYLATHALSVSAPLMQNKPDSKAGGWIILFAGLTLFSGIQAVVALFPCNELRWIGTTFFIVALIAWVATLTIGCYLWTNYLSLKRNIMRPMLIIAGITVIFSAILFTTAYIYSGLDLAAAKREALAVGLILNVPPPIPGTENDTARIAESARQYQIRLDAVKPKLPSRSGVHDDNYSWFSDSGYAQLPLETMRQAANFVLNDLASAKFYADLLQTLNKPSCRFDNSFFTQKFSGSELTTIDIIRNFIYDRAYALELSGRTQEAFECLELLDKLADSTDKPLDSFSKDLPFWIKFSKFSAAAKIGPDTPAEAKYYATLILQLDAMRPEFNDDTDELLKFLDNYGGIIGTSQGPLMYFRKIGAFLLASHNREAISNTLRYQIAYKQLFEQAATTTLTKLKPDIMNLEKQQFRLPVYVSIFRSPFQIDQCYRKRTQIATMKLYLALKIYKARHGFFPDALAKLEPGILPVIPLNPYNGENFEYHTEADGYSLKIEYIGSSTNNFSSYTDKYFYHPWNKNPVPVVQTVSKLERRTTLPRGRRSGNTGNHKTIQNKNEERAK